MHGLYNKNANAAWFDGIALKKEPAQTYKYDKEGNNAWSVKKKRGWGISYQQK